MLVQRHLEKRGEADDLATRHRAYRNTRAANKSAKNRRL